MKSSLLITSLLGALLPFTCVLGESWNVDANGNWGTPTNWSPATVPNAVGASAVFGNVITAPRSVTLDLTPTVGSISFNSPLNNYQILASGSNFLTMNNSPSNAMISVVSGTQIISAPLTLASNLTIDQQTIVPLFLSGVISGGASVTLIGSGDVTLTASNTFSNGLIINNGSLQCGAAHVLPAVGVVTMGGGELHLNSFAQTIGGLTGSSNVILGSGALSIVTSGANIYGGQISGTGSVTLGGTGSLTLTSTNGHTGGTTITGGVLRIGINSALNSTGSVTVNSPGTFDVNGFTPTIGSLSGSGSVTLGSGSLTIQGISPGSFSGVISGTGSVTQTGAQIQQFSGANTYTGGTVINGTLRMGAVNSIPAGKAVNVNGGTFDLNNFAQNVGTLTGTGSVTLGSAQLTVTPTASASFSGVISGAGSLVFQGPFLWNLLTAQTYTGGTTINGGTLQMGVPNALASGGPVVVNSPGVLSLNNNPLAIGSLAGTGSVSLGSGNLTLNTSTVTTFSGAISGTGALIVQGTGTQILLGPNSYSGGTTVNAAATLQGTTTSLQGTIVNNSVLSFSQSFSGTYGGPLSGGGALQIRGGGVVTLTGTPSQGSVSILGAQLNIAAGSNLTTPTVSIGAGGILGGGGTVTGVVNNGGAINPGPTLTVTGNTTFQTGSEFIANLTPTSSNQLIVGGIITIQGGSQVAVNVARGGYAASTVYPIMLSTAGAVVGQFQGTTLTNPFLSAELFYNRILPGSVELDLTIKPFSDVIRGGNAGAIAKCLTPQNFQRNSDLESIASQLIFLSVDQVRSILEEMQPSQLRQLTLGEQNGSLLAQQTISWRMAQFDRSECERNISLKYLANLWVSLAGSWSEEHPQDHEIGYHAPSVGLTAGFDGKISSEVYLGAAIEYGYTKLLWQESRGFSNLNRVSVGPYVSWVGKYGYLNGTLLGSHAHFDTTRKIPFFSRRALSEHTGKGALAHLDGGAVLHPIPEVSIIPFVMGDFVMGWEQGFQEKQAFSLNFSISPSFSTFFRSELGLKISKCSERSHGKWVHDIKASWVREERFHGRDLQAKFKEFSCEFTVEGLYPSRNLLDVGMGLTFLFKKDRFSTTVRYEGQFGKGISLQTGFAQLLTHF